ncbi:MAG: T9SS type A sorting domain-containing protein, partial [Aureispira sp.]
SVFVAGNNTPCNTSVSFTSSVQGNVGVFTPTISGFNANAVSYSWSFGSTGSIGQASLPSGWSLICLTVSDSICTETYCDSVFVAGNNTPCNTSVSFTSSVQGNVGVFTPTISGFNANAVSYSWSFGSTGSIGQAVLPSGWSLICLTVSDSLCTETYCDSVFVAGNNTSCNDHVVTLTLNHDNYASETSWDVRDAAGNIVASGNSYAWMNATTTYEDLCLPTGCYTLNVYDSWGDGMCCAYGSGGYSLADSAGTFNITGGSFAYVDSRNFCVGGATNPCGNLNNTTMSHTIGANGAVTFTSHITGNLSPTSYVWLVDGNVVATTANVTVNLSNGLHSYCLIVDDSSGLCRNVICDSILITNANSGPQGCAGIVPDMTVVQDSSNPYQLYVQPILNNVPSGSSFIFYWSFGDNSGAYGSQAGHTYNNYGSYNLCFVAIDSVSGCIINYCDTITLDSSGNFSRFVNKPGFSVNTLAPILNSNINTTNIETVAWEVELYPNPANRVINLQLNTPEALNGQVSILALTGQVVKQQILDQAAGNSQLQLSIEELPAGVYFVRLATENQQQTLKFIKE